MKSKQVIDHIVKWLKNYSESSGTEGFVIGISGGIDSAVTSVLCAMTGKRVILLNMPIRQNKNEFERGKEHIKKVTEKYKNTESHLVDLTPVLESCEKVFPKEVQEFLVMANTRARLRMTTLYAFATKYSLLVAGTGNKIEDFGVGFFTKYGDGGVDVSPIADLVKTEIYEIAKELGITQNIVKAKPTDGLFNDGRSDEDQIGATYPELEWAMKYIDNNENSAPTARQNEVLEIYRQRHRANRHKMIPIPVCTIPDSVKY